MRVGISATTVISQLRFPLIVLVVCAHHYSSVDAGYNLLTSGWDTYACVRILVGQTLVKVAMPLFFMFAGYLFFLNVETLTANIYWQKLRRRMHTLLLPYIIWNAIAALQAISHHRLTLDELSPAVFWNFYSVAGQQTDWTGHVNTLTAPIDMPLWFLRDLMVVSLLSPVVYWTIRRLGIPWLALLTVVYLSGIAAFEPGLSAYAVYFFSLGAYLSIGRHDPVAVACRLQWPAAAISLLLATAMLFTYGWPVFSSLMLAFRLTGAITVFALAVRLLQHIDRQLPELVVRSTYFIFLAHFVFTLPQTDALLFSLLGHSTAGLTAHYLVCPLLKCTVFCTLYAIYRRLKSLIFDTIFGVSEKSH